MALAVTLNLDDDREKVLNRLTNKWNKANPTDQRTPSQMLRQVVKDYLDTQASLLNNDDQLSLRAAYGLATPAEQTTIDSILNQYR